jgi:hypothetical protein
MPSEVKKPRQFEEENARPTSDLIDLNYKQAKFQTGRVKFLVGDIRERMASKSGQRVRESYTAGQILAGILRLNICFKMAFNPCSPS